MSELGMGTGIIIFEIAGVCLVFVIIWILKAEKRREVYEGEIARLKGQVESQERENSMLIDRLEDAESTVRELEEAGPSQSSQKNAIDKKIADKIKTLERENERLCQELAEARESVEEVFKAVYEE